MRRALALAAVSFLAACGAAMPWPTSSVSLSNLRCDEACQATDDPFRMTLQLDYRDPEGLLKSGTLAFSLDRVVDAGSVKVSGLVASPGKSGTLHFTVPLKLSSVKDGETFTLGVRAGDGGRWSNEVQKDFVIHL